MKKTITNVISEIQQETAKRWPNDQRMQDYCNGLVSDGLVLENGEIVVFEKPRIKKHFCYSTGYNGMSTEEQTKAAVEMANTARTNQQYFVDKNMKQNFGDYDQMLKDSKDYGIFAIQQYRIDSRLVDLRSGNGRQYDLNRLMQGYKLTEKDIEELKKIVKQEKEKFLKRLNTYLKKYGLSKVHSWTYCAD